MAIMCRTIGVTSRSWKKSNFKKKIKLF